MNRVDHEFNWSVFECTGFVFWQLLNCFCDFSFLKFTKSRYFFAIKVFLNFFGRMVFRSVLINVLKISFSRAGDVFFNLRVSVKFVKYLFKVCDIFSLSLNILLFLWRMIVLAVLLLLENSGFTVFQNFLVSVIFLKFKLLNYCCFAS